MDGVGYASWCTRLHALLLFEVHPAHTEYNHKDNMLTRLSTLVVITDTPLSDHHQYRGVACIQEYI